MPRLDHRHWGLFAINAIKWVALIRRVGKQIKALEARYWVSSGQIKVVETKVTRVPSFMALIENRPSRFQIVVYGKRW